MIRALAVVMICCASASEADTCDALTAFAAGQRPDNATCTTSRVLGGGTSTDCYWAFDFRADAAIAFFDAQADLLRHCADGPVTVEGATVNHPDSYDQLTADINGQAVSLSLKDKGALGQTLVFLRVTQPR